MAFPHLRRAAYLVAAGLTSLLLAVADPAHAQIWPAPGTSNHDTDGMGGNDLAVRRIDTDADGIADQVHIDTNSNGVVDAGERVISTSPALWSSAVPRESP